MRCVMSVTPSISECPFCGHNSTSFSTVSYDSGELDYIITCDNEECGASMSLDAKPELVSRSELEALEEP